MKVVILIACVLALVAGNGLLDAPVFRGFIKECEKGPPIALEQSEMFNYCPHCTTIKSDEAGDELPNARGFKGFMTKCEKVLPIASAQSKLFNYLYCAAVRAGVIKHGVVNISQTLALCEKVCTNYTNAMQCKTNTCICGYEALQKSNGIVHFTPFIQCTERLGTDKLLDKEE